jgi:hypothetical protein
LRRPVAALAAGLLLASCGGDDDPEAAKRAVVSYAEAVQARDAPALCRSLSSESRRLLGVLGEARFGSGRCARFMAAKLGEGFGSDPRILASARRAGVTIVDDIGRANVSGASLALAREDGRWYVDLAGTPRTGFALRAGAACSASDLAERRSPLPAATREGYAAAARASADRLERLAEELGPPRTPDLEPRTQLVEALRAQAAAVRRAGDRVAGGEPVLAATAAEAEVLGRATRAVTDAERRLGIECYGSAARQPGADAYRRTAERACTAVAARIDALPEPSGP